MAASLKGMTGFFRGHQHTLSTHCSAPVAPLHAEATPVTAPKVTLSPLVENMAVSKTIEIHSLTKDMERQGKVVYSLCVGEPDYQPPQQVIAATAAAATLGLTKYTAVTGETALREAIARDLSTRKNTPYSAEQIVVSNGAKQAVLQALLAVVCPGDSVLVPSPYWPSYPDMVKMCQALPVDVETSARDGYALTGPALRRALASNPKTSAIILCNPSNPTGCVMSEKQLREVADILLDYPRVTIISDEIYERLTYDTPHVSFASLPGMLHRTITINGFSKSHSMTGYRIGYAAAPLYIAKACGKLQSQMTSCASSIAQHAALAALNEVDDGWMAARRGELQAKRDLAHRLVQALPHTQCGLPSGAFYLLFDVSYFFGSVTADGRAVRDSHDLCLELLRCEQVALGSGPSLRLTCTHPFLFLFLFCAILLSCIAHITLTLSCIAHIYECFPTFFAGRAHKQTNKNKPNKNIVSGDAFGAPKCIRLSYAASEALIEETIGRLGRFLASLKKA